MSRMDLCLNKSRGLISGYWELDLRNVCEVKFKKHADGCKR